ncbi:MAG: hypothetical protein AAGA06_08035 [Pseudomonadota bacterium]
MTRRKACALPPPPHPTPGKLSYDWIGGTVATNRFNVYLRLPGRCVVNHSTSASDREEAVSRVLAAYPKVDPEVIHSEEIRRLATEKTVRISALKRAA